MTRCLELFSELRYISLTQILLLTVFGLAILLISVLSQPYIAVVVVPIIGVFVWLRQYFVKSSREIKRIEALSRSPLYSHISATLQGLATIRASEEQNQFHEMYNKYQDCNTSASYYYLAANRWLGYRLDIICAILMTFVAFAPFIAYETGLVRKEQITFQETNLRILQGCPRHWCCWHHLIPCIERTSNAKTLQRNEGYKGLTIKRIGDKPEQPRTCGARLFGQLVLSFYQMVSH
ncbi:multidrug resistance-associated 4-like, partial [Paramuricea clavata]